MSFVAPYFLIGLGALLVPIIIHMWSKDAKKTIAFGSLQFLKETETRTTRSIMPSQWLLLILRLLLLSLLVFLIAGMQFTSDKERAARLYLIDPIYQGTEVLKNLTDTVADDTELRWLATDFPLLEKVVPLTSNYWKLLGDLPADHAACLIVVSPLLQKEFIGKKREIIPVCQWIKPPSEVVETKLLAIAKNEVSYSLTANYDEWTTRYELTNGDAGTPVEIRYYVEATAPYENHAAIFSAAIQAIHKVSVASLTRVDRVEDSDWILWFSDETPPVDKNLITIDDRIFGLKRINDHLVKVSDSFTNEQAIQLELPRKLLDVFMINSLDDESNERLTVDLNLFQYEVTEVATSKSMVDASDYLWLLLLLVLIAERWLSFKSNKVST